MTSTSTLEAGTSKSLEDEEVPITHYGRLARWLANQMNLTQFGKLDTEAGQLRAAEILWNRHQTNPVFNGLARIANSEEPTLAVQMAINVVIHSPERMVTAITQDDRKEAIAMSEVNL